MPLNNSIITVEDFEKHIGAQAVDRILEKASKHKSLRVANVNSTYYGGGVAEMLSSLTLLMNTAGVKTGWRVIQGAPDFFSVTKKMHNALQSGDINLSQRKKEIYEEVVHQNAIRNHLDQHNMVVIHDPQPLPLVEHYKKIGPWIWRCHVDLSQPHGGLWQYLRGFIEQYDAVIVSLDEYHQPVDIPQFSFMPAIDPFSIKNRELDEAEIEDRLQHHGIPDDLPLVVQVSRFDKWKDPQGVIDAFKIAREEVDATLVLLGNVATDDPEGKEVYESLLDQEEERIIILSVQDTALVNALQRRACVVMQKSIREGFGLTVTEAMWKGAPVIGGNCGGIRHQIADGQNGFLVSSVDQAAQRIVQLLKDENLRRQLGQRARETVKEKFLLTRYMEQYFDLFDSFETVFRIKRKQRGAWGQ
jgi:trehalose synthase